MYQTIYDVVEKRGRIKTGILLNGKDAGLKYLAEENSFFYPEGAERNKEAEEFLKASVEAAVETGVVKSGDREIFVETYEKNPRQMRGSLESLISYPTGSLPMKMPTM